MSLFVTGTVLGEAHVSQRQQWWDHGRIGHILEMTFYTFLDTPRQSVRQMLNADDLGVLLFQAWRFE